MKKLNFIFRKLFVASVFFFGFANSFIIAKEKPFMTSSSDISLHVVLRNEKDASTPYKIYLDFHFKNNSQRDLYLDFYNFDAHWWIENFGIPKGWETKEKRLPPLEVFPQTKEDLKLIKSGQTSSVTRWYWSKDLDLPTEPGFENPDRIQVLQGNRSAKLKTQFCFQQKDSKAFWKNMLTPPRGYEGAKISESQLQLIWSGKICSPLSDFEIIKI